MIKSAAKENEITKRPMPFAKTEARQVFDKALAALVGTEMGPNVHISVRDVAAAAGYERPNIFSMFRSGETKIPIDRAFAMARALKIDEAHFMRLVMKQHWPEVAAQFDTLFGGPLSANERKLLELWRNATSNEDPNITGALKQRLREVIRETREAGEK